MKKVGLSLVIILSFSPMEKDGGSKSASPKEGQSPNTSRISRASRRISTDLTALRERLSRVSNEDLSQSSKEEKIKELKDKLSKVKQISFNPRDREKLLKEIIESPAPEACVVKLEAIDFYIDLCSQMVKIHLINAQTHNNLKQFEHAAAAIQIAKKNYYETRKMYIEKLKHEQPAKPLYDHEYETDRILKALKNNLEVTITGL